MTQNYVSVIFTAKPGAFTDDATLVSAIEKKTGHNGLTLERMKDEDGDWSGWYNLKPASDTDIKSFAASIEKITGISHITLQTSAHTFEPLHATPTPGALGAIPPSSKRPIKPRQP